MSFTEALADFRLCESDPADCNPRMLIASGNAFLEEIEQLKERLADAEYTIAQEFGTD